LTTWRPIWIATSSDDAQYLPEQELEDEDRHVGADLDLADEVLAHDLAGEQPVHLVVERIACGGRAPLLMLHSKSNRDVGGRAVQLRVGRRVLHDDAQRGALSSLSRTRR
jgi:hypothetical protein